MRVSRAPSHSAPTLYAVSRTPSSNKWSSSVSISGSLKPVARAI
jgi:hypothetical protein